MCILLILDYRFSHNERRKQILLLQGFGEPSARTPRGQCAVRGPSPGLRGGVFQTHSVFPLCQVKPIPNLSCVILYRD